MSSRDVSSRRGVSPARGNRGVCAVRRHVNFSVRLSVYEALRNVLFRHCRIYQDWNTDTRLGAMCRVITSRVTIISGRRPVISCDGCQLAARTTQAIAAEIGVATHSVFLSPRPIYTIAIDFVRVIYDRFAYFEKSAFAHKPYIRVLIGLRNLTLPEDYFTSIQFANN